MTCIDESSSSASSSSSSSSSISHDEIDTRDIFLTSDERFDVWNVKQEERPHLLQYSCDNGNDNGNDDAHANDNDADDDSTHTSLKKKEIRNKDEDGDDDGEHDNSDDETNDDNSLLPLLPLPLLDGCDLPGWRKEGLILSQDSVLHHPYQQGILNVGLGCTLMRRESELSACLSNKLLQQSAWKELQAKLFEEPPSLPGTAFGGPSLSIVDGRSAAIRLSPQETKGLTGSHPWFEKQNVPVILEGCTETWKAMETCTWQNLLKEYGDYQWRFSDTHGACMSLETYTKYTKSMEGLTDDAPLAVYDSQLHLDERVQLLNDYEVPPCFDGMDLFQDVMLVEQGGETNDDDNESGETNHYHQQPQETENNNDDDADSDNDSSADNCSTSSLEGPSPPPYRWILMGPARSGTGLHVDPLGTHAWVTVVEGCKRWVLFPADTNQASIGMQDPQIPSSIWFAQWYPRLQKEFQTTYKGAIEVLQRPGDTVYVPAGWPHLVLNLEDTVAITHNYASEYPRLSLLQEAVQEAEPELYQAWWPKLQASRPDLFVEKEPNATEVGNDICGVQEEKKED
ncbi:unnamed protein product [Cylindrotheca closterium]|uniref:JmjC domain-containing protein n=1 Tax=Cylindrotheca closterium TaxID=2856 RepID=A0AAD2PVM1_9STRA|nr:unnamed protein product [Cylindrotheca closterium]